jgi:hypothetical protein
MRKIEWQRWERVARQSELTFEENTVDYLCSAMKMR